MNTAARPLKTVYTCVNTMYLGTNQYISVYTRIKHLAKKCIVSRFEPWIACIQQGCSDRYTTSVDIESVYHMIYLSLHIIVWLELRLSRLRPLRQP